LTRPSIVSVAVLIFESATKSFCVVQVTVGIGGKRFIATQRVAFSCSAARTPGIAREWPARIAGL
jgi:hypothetical protein